MASRSTLEEDLVVFVVGQRDAMQQRHATPEESTCTRGGDE